MKQYLLSVHMVEGTPPLPKETMTVIRGRAPA